MFQIKRCKMLRLWSTRDSICEPFQKPFTISEIKSCEIIVASYMIIPWETWDPSQYIDRLSRYGYSRVIDILREDPYTGKTTSLYWDSPLTSIWLYNSNINITHCGLVTPHGGRDLGQYWFWWWHYLNQCWLIINKGQRHSSEGNFTRYTLAMNPLN